MSARLISDESAARFNAAASFVETNGSGLLNPLKEPQIEEHAARPATRGVLMETVDEFGKTYWVQPKYRVPHLHNWLIRYLPNRNPDDPLVNFEIRVTIGVTNYDVTVTPGMTGPALLDAINAATSNVLSSKIWCKLGANAIVPDGTSHTCESWFLSCSTPILQGVSYVEPADPEQADVAEVIQDADSPFYAQPVKAYKVSDSNDMLPGTLVVLVDIPGIGWSIVGGTASFKDTTTPSSSSCGQCSVPLGTEDVDLTDLVPNLIGSQYYDADPFCNGLLHIIFTYDAENTEEHRWNGDAFDGMEIVCVGEEATLFEAWIVVNGHLPGEVEIHLKDADDNEWVWINRECWQPDQEWEFTRVSGPATCECSPFRGKMCLRPLSDPGA